MIGWGYLFDPVGQVAADGWDFDNDDTSSYFSQDSSSIWQGRPGVLALRLSYPIQSNNLYLHLVLDEQEEGYQVVVVPKVDYVLGKTDFSAAFAYSGGRPLQFMGSFSSSVGRIGVFGETVVTLDGEESASPWQSQLGAFYNHSDDEGLFNLSSAVFYQYNEDHSVGISLGWNDILNPSFLQQVRGSSSVHRFRVLSLSLQLPR